MDKVNAGGNAKGDNGNKGTGGTKAPGANDTSKRDKDMDKERGNKPAGKGR